VSYQPTRVDVVLSDGSTAVIRPVGQVDSQAVRAFFGGLSQQSVVFRFFGPHRMSDEEVERLASADGVDRLVLAAELHGSFIAVAEYYRITGGEEAEVAFAVADAFQGRGIGTILLEHLAEAARRVGIKRFVADTLSENARMLSVFRDAGFARRYQREHEVVNVALDLNPSEEARHAVEERDRSATVASVSCLFRPHSVAVVGAGRTPGTIGHELLRNLVNGGFMGPVYPVNPSATSVASMVAWPSVTDVPGPVDLAVVVVPEPEVLSVVQECGKKGVRSLVVISAGFAEAGHQGLEHERELALAAHAQGMRVVGPNCFGVVNTDPDVSMNATFAATKPEVGRVGFASQSGGLGIAILEEARTRGLGLSTFVSMGNKADMSGNDFLEWWEQDDATSVALLYLESFGNPRKFRRIAGRFSRSKPIVAVKSGRSAAGVRAATSHTAALASPDRAVDALFTQTGAIRVDTIEELFDVTEILVNQPLPKGRRVGIVSNAGGPGVLAADACMGAGLEIPELSPDLQGRLRSLLAPGAGVRNPVDMVASATPAQYRAVLDLLLAGDEVDSVIVIFTPPLVTHAADVKRAVSGAVEVASAASASGERTAKPVVASFLGSPAGQDELSSGGLAVPSFTYPETAARALGRAVGYRAWLERPVGEIPVLDRTEPNTARRLTEGADHDGWLTGAGAMEVLSSYGISVLETVAVRDVTRAVEVSERLGLPVALKATGPGIVHKSDVGGVRLGLQSPSAVRDAYADMERTTGGSMSGAVVQPMAPPGVEVIAGFVQDDHFGAQVVFGLGGTAVELLGDSVVRLAPLSDVDAREMISGLRGAALLTGYRFGPPANLEALVDLLLRLSQLAEDLPEISELDCNPVIAGPNGAIAVDARLRRRTRVTFQDERRRLRS